MISANVRLLFGRLGSAAVKLVTVLLQYLKLVLNLLYQSRAVHLQYWLFTVYTCLHQNLSWTV